MLEGEPSRGFHKLPGQICSHGLDAALRKVAGGVRGFTSPGQTEAFPAAEEVAEPRRSICLCRATMTRALAI